MKSPLVQTIAVTAVALVSGCGGGGGGSGGFALPVTTTTLAAAPAPAPAPPPEIVPPPPAAPPVAAPAPAPVPQTWTEKNCSPDATTSLPACSTDFSDNNAHTTVVQGQSLTPPVSAPSLIQLQAIASPLSPTKGYNSAGYGNKAVYGINFLHKVALSDFPGISFSMKLNNANTTLVDAYVTYTVNLTCSDTNQVWLDLITAAGDMTPSVADSDGFSTYTATIHDAKWARSGGNPLISAGTVLGDGTVIPAGTVILHSAYGTDSPNPMSLDQLIAIYPQACIYNFVNPDAHGIGVTPTPAVEFNLSDTRNVLDKEYWLKNIVFGTATGDDAQIVFGD